MKHLWLGCSVFLLFAACSSQGSKNEKTVASEGANWSLTEVWSTDTVLNTCESVLYDPSGKRLFVSCINGSPEEKNGTGFISLLKPDGTIEALEWVNGLNAPKGMGVDGNRLYVADVDQLVVIDIREARVIEKLEVEGASFLNDVAIGPDGTVYFTDSNTGTIWTCRDGNLEPWITAGLEGPNGLCAEESRVLLTSSGSSDLKIIDISTGEIQTVTKEIGQGDGIEYTGTPGIYLTSSWPGEIFLILPDFSKIPLLKTSDRGINSADIGFNREQQIVYVPTFFDNRVVAYHLAKSN